MITSDALTLGVRHVTGTKVMTHVQDHLVNELPGLRWTLGLKASEECRNMNGFLLPGLTNRC